jgi:predicted alpha/beta superfamily hydrolase
MKLPILLITALAIASACTTGTDQPVQSAQPSTPSASVQPYVLENTEVRDIHAKQLNRDYQVFVSLPDGYAASKQTYPVLFVTDANYGFPLVRSITQRIGNHSKQLKEFILVGLSYAKGDSPTQSRDRDYTPTVRREDAGNKGETDEKMHYGEAEGYRRFVKDEVFPLIAQNYRADMAHKVIAGHSYGSLFGAYVLLADPTMFEHYILSSPSLWYDDHVMFKQLRAYIATHDDLPAKVYLATGEYEGLNPNPKVRNPRYATDMDMVADMRRFEQQLRAQHYPSLQIQSAVIADEDHLTVNPATYTRGLIWALGRGS